MARGIKTNRALKARESLPDKKFMNASRLVASLLKGRGGGGNKSHFSCDYED